jgi:hypothetical protein
MNLVEDNPWTFSLWQYLRVYFFYYHGRKSSESCQSYRINSRICLVIRFATRIPFRFWSKIGFRSCIISRTIRIAWRFIRDLQSEFNCNVINIANYDSGSICILNHILSPVQVISLVSSSNPSSPDLPDQCLQRLANPIAVIKQNVWWRTYGQKPWGHTIRIMLDWIYWPINNFMTSPVVFRLLKMERKLNHICIPDEKSYSTI